MYSHPYIFLSFISLWFTAEGVFLDTFRAAVVEYEPIETSQVTLESTLENAYALAKYAVEARWEGVDLLVFPEYGLTGMIRPERHGANTFAQDIPDPKVNAWNPCEQPDLFPNTKVLQVLSCASKYNALVIVANLIGREICDITDPTCPPDSHYYFNTNVIFHKNGTLAARYRKRHLYLEPNITPALESELTVVDVGFTKLASVICFDIVHKDPTINLIREKGVKTLIFPTAWVNILPFFTAPQLYTSISRGMGINLIAANHYAPSMSRLGSGIFSSNKGALNQTYDLASPGKMVVADVPINPEEVSAGDLRCDDESHFDHSEEYGAVHPALTFEEPITQTHEPSSTPTSEVNVFVNLKLEDFNFYYFDVNKMEGHVDLCKGDFCCNLDYTFEKKDDTVYAFGVHDGIIHVDESEFGVQICSVLRCETTDPSTCGRVPQRQTHTIFHRLAITGSFETDVVLPQILGSNLQLIPGNNWVFNVNQCYDEDGGEITVGKMQLVRPSEQPIMVASLVGQMFDRNK